MKKIIDFRVYVVSAVLASIVALMMMSLLNSGPVEAQGIPAAPYLFSGNATVSGGAVPDGIEITARIGEYESEPVLTIGGRFILLTVSPDLDESRSLENLPIHFYLDGVQASESAIYRLAGLPVIDLNFNLTFPNLPVPTPTPTSVPVLPAVYSGAIAVRGGIVPQNGVLIAQVGDYVSPPAVIQGDGYVSLVVDPNDPSLEGKVIRFVLEGIIASRTDIYVSGKFVRGFDLLFETLPTPTPLPATATPIPPTATTVLPSPTPLPPTVTPIPASSTLIPATMTSVPPTPILSSPTPVVVATMTSIRPTPTPTPTPTPIAKATIPAVVAVITSQRSAEAIQEKPGTSGDCGFSPGGPSGNGGIGGLLSLLAPLGFMVGLRRTRSRAKDHS